MLEQPQRVLSTAPVKASTPRKSLTAIIDMILPMAGHHELSPRWKGTTVQAAHILVIDDNSRHYGQVVSGLISQGFVAQIAETTEQALTLLHQQPFDAVLLEAMTPTLNGYKALKAIKSDPQFSQLPVIMMSSQSDLELVIKCIELGAEDYLFEPLQGTLLKARIAASLERKAARARDNVRLTDAKTLRTISQAMNATLDAERVMKIAFSHALQRLNPTAGLIGTLNNGVLTVVASFGFEERFTVTNRLPLSEMGWQSAVQAERPYTSQYQALVKDASGLSPFASCTIVPIRRQRLMGVMMLYHAQDSSAEAACFIEQLAEDTAVALWNATLYSEAVGCVEHQQVHLNSVSREIKLASTTIKEFTSLLKLNTWEVTRGKKMEMLDAIRHHAAHLFALSADLETKIKRQRDDEMPVQPNTGDSAAADDMRNDLPPYAM
ncbi:MAG: response regulator transcription factor [Anaerolineae bacterium]|nr:response regulator transcription factor [Anaerolineae bacterium]